MRAFVFVATILFWVSTAEAGEIFGTITEGGKTVAQGLRVEVRSSGKTYKTETDKFGAYRVFVKGKGKSSLILHMKDQALSAEVVSYDKSTRYDWIVETKADTLALRRK